MLLIQVRGTVVFDSIAWIFPISVSTVAACALLRIQISDPRLVSLPASRHKRLTWEYSGFAYIIGIVSVFFAIISQARISQIKVSNDIERWPQLTFADLIVKAITFCFGPAGERFFMSILGARRQLPRATRSSEFQLEHFRTVWGFGGLQSTHMHTHTHTRTHTNPIFLTLSLLMSCE